MSIKLIDLITSINETISKEDNKVREVMIAGQKAYQAKIAEAKELVKDNAELAYELGRFVTDPQQYQLPLEHMPKPADSANEAPFPKLVSENGNTLN